MPDLNDQDELALTGDQIDLQMTLAQVARDDPKAMPDEIPRNGVLRAAPEFHS
jgi:hypothetical protein